MGIFSLFRGTGSQKIDSTQPKEELSEDELLTEFSLYRRNYGDINGVEEYPDPVGVQTYMKMYQQDAQCRAGVSAICLPIMARGYTFKHPVDSAGWDDTIDSTEKQIEFLEHVFENMRISLDETLEQMLSAVVYGFSVSEPVYWRIKEGEWKGKIGLKKIKTVNPLTISFKMNDYGDVVEVIQEIGDKKIHIPAEKVIHFPFQSDFGSPYGASALHPVHKHWYIKDMIYKFKNMALERQGTPLLVGVVKNKNEVSKMRKILDNVMSRVGIAISGTDDIKVLDSTKTMDFMGYINHHNMMILRGLMIPSLLFGNEDSGTGSYALSETHFNLYLFRLESIQRDLEKIINDKVIKKLIDMNFGKQKLYPRFQFNPLQEKDRNELADIFFKLVNAKIVEPTEYFVRDALGLPQMDKEHRDRVKREIQLKLQMLEDQAKASKLGVEEKKEGAQESDEEDDEIKVSPTSKGTKDMNSHPYNTKGRGDMRKKESPIQI